MAEIASPIARVAATRRTGRLRQGNRAIGWLVLPAAVLLAVFVVVPVVFTGYLSVLHWNLISPNPQFVGFENYMLVLTDPKTYTVLWNSLLYFAIMFLLAFVLPYAFAYVCHFFLSRRQQTAYKIIFFTPTFISLAVAATVFSWILNPISGPVAQVLTAIGLNLPDWTHTPGLVVVVIGVIVSWQAFGYNFVVLLAGVANVPESIIEAARVDDIPSWRIFVDIVLPMSGGIGYYVFVITLFQSMQAVFVPISLLTQGGPNYASSNLIYDAYDMAFGTFDTGGAAALSILTTVLFLAVYGALQFVNGTRVHHAN
jgi:sn-glycerol 3-phosphate transport system permease protein